MLGHFCTGVTVITTVDAAGPAGFACQSFAALSLDPPLVLFCPSRSSATWPRIEPAGHFCANVLADEQRELARVFGAQRRGADKFDGVRLVARRRPGRRCSTARSPGSTADGGGRARGRGPLRGDRAG